MSVASDLARRMADAGASGDLIAMAIEALSKGEDEIESRRANDRERKRRQRDKDVTVTGQSRDADGTVENPPPILDKESVPQTPFKEIKPTPDTETRARKADPFPCPEGVEAQHWRDFLGNRRTRRLTNTPTAYDGILSRIAELSDDEWPPGKLVQFAAGKGWGSINDPRESEHRNGHGRLAQRETGNSGIGTTRAAAERVKAQIRSAREFAAGQSGGSG